MLTRQFNSVQESEVVASSLLDALGWAPEAAHTRREKHCFHTVREELPVTDDISPFSEHSEGNAKRRLGKRNREGFAGGGNI